MTKASKGIALEFLIEDGTLRAAGGLSCKLRPTDEDVLFKKDYGQLGAAWAIDDG